jgi:hypothetical protein
MKCLVLILSLLFAGAGAHADAGDRSYFGGGFRLGLGYTFVDYEQKMSDTGTDFTAGASQLNFLYLSYMYEMSPSMWFLLYGSLGYITFDSTPGTNDQTHSSMTGDVNAEMRFTFGEHSARESWVPMYILGVNAAYMPIVRAPKSVGANYEYGQVPLVSPVVGATTTWWGDSSAWRNTVRFGIPLFSGSGLTVGGGYIFSAVTSYTFALGENTTIGVEGVVDYLAVKLTESSAVTGLDVEHNIHSFAVGPRIFLTIGW